MINDSIEETVNDVIIMQGNGTTSQVNGQIIVIISRLKRIKHCRNAIIFSHVFTIRVNLHVVVSSNNAEIFMVDSSNNADIFDMIDGSSNSIEMIVIRVIFLVLHGRVKNTTILVIRFLVIIIWDIVIKIVLGLECGNNRSKLRVIQ